MVSKRGALHRIRAFLDASEPKLVRILQTLWRKQQTAITYAEIEKAFIAGDLTQERIEQWQLDYSKLINEKLALEWFAAMNKATQHLREDFPSVVFLSLFEFASRYLKAHGAELVTRLVQEQTTALKSLLQYSGLYEGMTADGLSRFIRPLVGLTVPQVTANRNHYATVFNKHLESGLKKADAEKLAQKSSAKYAARQHRYRAQTIARTELAGAYNHSADDAIRQAQAAGYIGDVDDVWCTADDEGVCDGCGPLDDKVTDEIPPKHPRCRCTKRYVERNDTI